MSIFKLDNFRKRQQSLKEMPMIKCEEFNKLDLVHRKHPGKLTGYVLYINYESVNDPCNNKDIYKTK